LGTGYEVRYQATSTAHSDLLSHSSYPEGKPVTGESGTEAPGYGQAVSGRPAGGGASAPPAAP
jgi:hypothetical protein